MDTTFGANDLNLECASDSDTFGSDSVFWFIKTYAGCKVTTIFYRRINHGLFLCVKEKVTAPF